jgi:hypothetical protein
MDSQCVDSERVRQQVEYLPLKADGWPTSDRTPIVRSTDVRE